jgi:hypothetical protein
LALASAHPGSAEIYIPRIAVYTGFYRSGNHIQGREGYSSYFINDDFIYGPRGRTRYYISDGCVFGPKGYTHYYFSQEHLCGPSTKPPWLSAHHPSAQKTAADRK